MQPPLVLVRGGKRLMHRHGRRCALHHLVALLRPHDLRRRWITRKARDAPLQIGDLAQRSVMPPQIVKLHGKAALLVDIRLRQAVDLRLDQRCAHPVVVAHRLLRWRIAHLALERLDALHQTPIVELRHPAEPVLVRNHRHRNQERHDQDDVLRNLRPRHRAHAAKKRAHQNAREPAENADRKVDADKARRDQSDALDLRDEINERAQDRRQRRKPAYRVARKARAEKIGNRVARELAHVRRKQKRDEAIATRPAHHVRETVIARCVQGARQPDERGRRQPVRRRRHAVERGRHAPPRYVVFDEIGSPRQQADYCIHGNRHEQEHVADPRARPADGFDTPEQIDEDQKADRVERIRADQPMRELHRSAARSAKSSVALAASARRSAASARCISTMYTTINSRYTRIAPCAPM